MSPVYSFSISFPYPVSVVHNENGSKIVIYSVADLRGDESSACVAPTAQHFLNFWKIWQNHMLAPFPGMLPPPPTGNPGSTPAIFL